jgi:hypothetical protein
MTTTAYNTSKQRLETVDVELTDENTTWFKHSTNAQDIYTITDVHGGLLIAELNYNYPIWVDGVSRADINHSKRKAEDLVTSLKIIDREK